MHPRHGAPRGRARGVFVLCSCLAFFEAPPSAGAEFPGATELAEAMVQNATPRWTGPRVPDRVPTPRPASRGARWASRRRPLAVHVAGPAVPDATGAAALDALETAYEVLRRDGWTPPPDDGGRGGGHDFDLYLVPGASAEGRTDGRYEPSFLDRATTYGVVGTALPRNELLACVTTAYASALLLALDPAEADGWRAATAAWLAHRVSGRYGCGADPIGDAQHAPWRPWIDASDAIPISEDELGDTVGSPPPDPAGGALLVGMLADDLDGGDGTYVRHLWDAGRQLTWEGEGLRGWPDLWHAVEATVTASGGRLSQVLERLAVERFFAGRRGRSTYPTIEALGATARIPSVRAYRYGGRAFEVPPARPALHPHGSDYVLLDVEAAPRDAPVGLWLRGEVGVEWAMAAVRLGPDDQPLARMSAPVRREPNAFLPVALDRRTRRVLVVVTNLGADLPDPTRSDEGEVRSFLLRVGRP